MNSRSFLNLSAAAALLATGSLAHAAGFSAGISPSKFELRARAGQTLRDTISIMNPAEDAEDYQFRTADWRLSDSGSVEFIEDELLDGSCRPWVKLERKALRINPGAQRNYRFEIHVPEDAPTGLCRFAILVEPAEAFNTTVGSGESAINVPIVGRYAIVTYVTIGDAAAEIELVGIGTQNVSGQRLPAVTLRNTGNTYDRAFGNLTSTDFRGERVRLVPSSFPVLPGRTESLPMVPDVGPTEVGTVSLTYPLRLIGEIEIGGNVIPIDAVLE
jgi:hypothetical protein